MVIFLPTDCHPKGGSGGERLNWGVWLLLVDTTQGEPGTLP